MKRKNANVKVTRKQFQKAEERAIEEMAAMLEGKSSNEREAANATAMMYLVLQATTKIEGLLFGEDENMPRIEFLGWGDEGDVFQAEDADDNIFAEPDICEQNIGDDIYSFGMGDDFADEGIIVVDEFESEPDEDEGPDDRYDF